jgi:nitrate/TMAO reductase-like tetraheme cytochrome c subunit
MRNPKLFWLILSLGVIICISLIEFRSYSTAKGIKDDTFCASCHEMNASVVTWQVTNHNSVQCTKCHSDLPIATLLIKHWAKAYKEPISMRGIVENSTCNRCHSTKRDVTPPGNLIVPHDLHVLKGVDCVDCHTRVVHLDVNQKLLIEKGLKSKDINEKLAKSLVINNNRISKPDCMICHNGYKAPNDCKACHLPNLIK